MNKRFTDIATFVSQRPSVKTDAFLACAGMGLCGEGPASGDLASMQMTGPFASSASLFGFLLEERLQTAVAKVEVINRLMLGCLHPIASGELHCQTAYLRGMESGRPVHQSTPERTGEASHADWLEVGRDNHLFPDKHKNPTQEQDSYLKFKYPFFLSSDFFREQFLST